MQFNFDREWLERKALEEDACDCTAMSPQFMAFMEATGPYTVHLEGQTELVTAEARYDSFEDAVAHARSLSNWNHSVDIRDEPTGNVVHSFFAHNTLR